MHLILLASDGGEILVCIAYGLDFVLFDLILYVPVNNFVVMLGWVFLG